MASSSSSVQTVVLGRSTKSYFSTHFSDASNTQERAVFFRIFIGGSVTVILALLSIFSIYWGALWKIPAHQLDGWVVNFDGSGEIGTAFTQGLLSSSSGPLKWELRDDLPGLANVGDMIREEKAWFAVVTSDEIEPSEVLGGRSQVLRCSQTITAWYTAVCAVVNSSSRFPPATMMLDVYRVDTLPLRHNVSQQDVLFFKTNYLEHLQKCGVPEHGLKRTNIFVDDMTRGSGFIEQVNSASVHTEAAAMGLMCISLFDSPPFGEITKGWVDSALPTSGRVSIAASKKCCWCCALLARLLTQENTHAVEFVLPGTHAIIFSWSPPRGVPLVILQKMRDSLAIAFTHEAKSYEALPSSTAKAAAVIVDNCLYPLPS